jgi:hypothetical protein
MPISNLDKEKQGEAAHHYEDSSSNEKGIDIASTPEAQDASGPATAPDEREDKAVRRLIRKIDIRLLPCLAVIYAFAMIDRVNLPNARIAGMDEDLGLSIGDRYSLVVMIFFVSGFFSNFWLDMAENEVWHGTDKTSHRYHTSSVNFPPTSSVANSDLACGCLRWRSHGAGSDLQPTGRNSLLVASCSVSLNLGSTRDVFSS